MKSVFVREMQNLLLPRGTDHKKKNKINICPIKLYFRHVAKSSRFLSFDALKLILTPQICCSNAF